MKIQTPANAARVIKTQRLKLSLTQQDVAEAVNITRQSLARIEKGNGGGSFDTYLRLFDLLNISLEAIPDSPQTLEGSEIDEEAAPPLQADRSGYPGSHALAKSYKSILNDAAKPVAQRAGASLFPIKEAQLAAVSKTNTDVYKAITRSFASIESFQEFNRQISALQNSLAENSVNLSQRAIGLTHLKSVIDSSEPGVTGYRDCETSEELSQ